MNDASSSRFPLRISTCLLSRLALTMDLKPENTSIDDDKEYSPSMNSHRFSEAPQPNVAVFEHFMKTTKVETDRVREKYKIRENVRYNPHIADVPNDNCLMDIYFKDCEMDTPIFVFIHGGYWQRLDKSTCGSFVAPLVERNYRVLVVDYNLCPAVTLEQLVNEHERFYDWLLDYAVATNASDIAICGHSAGAHLATFAFSHPVAARTSAFYLISGVYDLRELCHLECVNPNNILSINDVIAATLSPICRTLPAGFGALCLKYKLRFHILVAAFDSAAFRRQSREYAQFLAKAGVDVFLKVFENYDHFNIIEEAADSESAISQYICQDMENNDKLLQIK